MPRTREPTTADGGREPGTLFDLGEAGRPKPERERSPPRRPPAKTKAEAYAAKREAMARKSREESQAGSEIGPLPKVVDPARRAHALSHFRHFCETYGRGTFTLAWSKNHLKILNRFDDVIRNGGLYALADMRGGGKTAIAEWAILFAAFGGFRRFGVFISKSSAHAKKSLDSIKKEIETNELLAEDFPEVCHPIEKMDGIVNRCHSQKLGGERTRVKWSDDEIVLPTVIGSVASGFIGRAVGIDGQIRGMFFKRPDGQRARPDFVVVDDPQDDEIARNPQRVKAMEEIIDKAILGLAGPGHPLACVALVTVIEQDDLADRLLDRKRNPRWRGERYRMLESMPSERAMTFWEQFRTIQGEDLEGGGDGSKATDFYAANQAAMDDGAVASWPERFDDGELSAIQHAMNLWCRNPNAFFCEAQNQPAPKADVTTDVLTKAGLESRLNGVERGIVPQWADHLIAYIDIQGDLLYWLVSAWADNFTGAVVDYGAWPEQSRDYFTVRDAKSLLSKKYPQETEEGCWFRGLGDLCARILGREWERDGGDLMRVERCLIDASYGNSTETIYQFCRASAHSAVLSPSHGKGIGASRAPMRDWQKQPGERVGPYWRFRRGKQLRAIRHVLLDTNYWKSFVAARLRTSMGAKGALSLFGKDPRVHRMLVDHLTAEMPVRTDADGNVVDEWRERQPGLDNHWFDCLVGTAVAASMLGAKLPIASGSDSQRRTTRRVVTSAEVRERKERLRR